MSTPENPAATPAPAPAQTSMAALRAGASLAELNQKVDLFSAGGFALGQRIATALASSSAVPALYRQWVEKKKPNSRDMILVENPNALGNCLVAIDIAQNLGVSVMSVMQNGNVIEGRFTWSSQYKIAAVNASKRFTPLRFEKLNLGPLNASYKEKIGWNEELRRVEYKDIEVTGLDNLEVIAWALPYGFVMPAGVYTLAQAKAAGLPVIEGPPVSMLLAVEEGWYGKTGSKWQTEMKHLMLNYRAGSFFGNIHAPDLLIGMNMTSEEAEDITTITQDAHGNVTSVQKEHIVRPAAQPAEVVTKTATTVTQKNGDGTGIEEPQGESGEIAGLKTDKAEKTAGADAAAAKTDNPQLVGDEVIKANVMKALAEATTEEQVQDARKHIPQVEDAMTQAELNAAATKAMSRVTVPAAAAAAAAAPAAAPASRRTRPTSPSKPALE